MIKGMNVFKFLCGMWLLTFPPNMLMWATRLEPWPPFALQVFVTLGVSGLCWLGGNMMYKEIKAHRAWRDNHSS